MSAMKRSSSRSTTSSEDLGGDTSPSNLSETSSVSGDEGYPATSFPGYAEKPLEEQLEPIAVIGMGCRLPGDVSSSSEFWDLMMSKGTGQTPKVPASRFNIDAHLHANNDRPGSFGVKGGYFLNGDLADFDPALFGITPVEAMWMDPQQRKLLEVVYEALESGGISLDRIAGTRTAVFAASFTADWQQMAFKEHSFRHSLAATGVDPGIISNRISHVFNLSGPSIMCNTACSSSVYALHNACNALRNREAEGAIVGGVNLIITVDQHMNTAKLGVLSPTSTCHTFDASADGYGRADAVGAVYLKRLSDALAAGDPVRGVIRSSATNSNGKVPGNGITHPNRDGQAEVIRAAYRRGGDLDPRLTGYFECHGTGTAVGDPLEVHAVSLAMNRERRAAAGDEPLLIGAVKTNIGHSEAASGLSALIRAILIVERGVVPATRGLVNPSPAIRWDEWQVAVPTEAVPLPRHLPVRRVSVNSFGYGGTNAHMIVEGAESLVPRGRAAPYVYADKWTRQAARFTGRRRALERQRPFLLPFSAHDKATLRRNVDAHARVVGDYSMLDLAYTLGSRRSALASRAYTVASNDTVADAFARFGERFAVADKKTARALGFVFTGQGSQWARMGAELITYSPVFLRTIRALDLVLEHLEHGPQWSIEDVLLEHADSSPINEAEFSQPLCTAVQVAMVDQLASWGVSPAVVVGHSSGEIAAAYAAGLITSSQAIIAAYYRGLVAKDIRTHGAMLAVGLGAEAVEKYLAESDGKVLVACHNSPALVTLSGDADALEAVKARLDADQVFNRVVKTNGKAYHSHHMEPVAQRYEELIRSANTRRRSSGLVQTPAVMVSSVTNTVLPAGTALDETYWSANLCNPVLFNQAVQTLLTSPRFSDVDLLVEVGPHSAMAGPVKQIKAEVKAEKIEYVATLQRGADSASRLLSVAGELFLRSYPIDMDKVAHAYIDETAPSAAAGGKPARGSVIVDLPPYQWNYTRPFWAESRTSREQRQPQFPRHDVLGQRVIGGSLSEPVWRNVLRARDLPWLADHRLGGESVFPAAGYFAMAIEAARQVHEASSTSAQQPPPIEGYVLRDVSIDTALVVPDESDDDGIEVLLSLRPSVHGGRWQDWSVSSIDGEGTVKSHMSGSVGLNMRARGAAPPRPVPAFPQRATGAAWNKALRGVGFDYGKTFQDMEDVRFDGRTYRAACATKIRQSVDAALGESRYALHPAAIDATLQLCIAAVHAGRTSAMECGVVPVKVEEVAIWPPTEAQLATETASAYAVVHRRGARMSESTVELTAADGEMVMQITNMRAVAYEAAVPQKDDSGAQLEAAPYGEMAWGLDFDVPENRAGLSAPQLVNQALFKYPDFAVMEVGAASAGEILSAYPRTAYTAVVTSDEELEAAEAALAGYSLAKAVKVDPSQHEDLKSTGLKEASQDILIAPVEDDASGLVSLLKGALKSPASSIGNGVMVTSTSTSSEQEKEEKQKGRVQLVYRTTLGPVASEVKGHFERLGWDVSTSSLLSTSLETAAAADHVIMLADIEGPLLFTIDDQEFASLKKIIATASNLLWVSAGSFVDGKRPEHAMVSGLARVLSAEQASLDMRILDVDLESTKSGQIAEALAKLAQLQLAKTEKQPEREFCLKEGKTYISRLVRNHNLNRKLSPPEGTELKPFAAGDRLSGQLWKGEVAFKHGEACDLPAGHVEVQVTSSGVTKEGALALTGVDYSTYLSHEIGGVVTQVGAGVSGLKSGDKVVGFSTSRFDSYQQMPASLVQKLEAGDDETQMVSALTAYASAIHGLVTLANVKKDEKVLIPNNTGFAGAAAIMVAHLQGAMPLVMAQTDDERAFLTQHLKVNEGHILDAFDSLLWERIGQLTLGRGPDVVFSSSGVEPSTAREAWRHIAPYGRLVDSGRKDNVSRNVIDHNPFRRGASYMPFDFVDIYQAQPELLATMLPTILADMRQGKVAAPGPVRSIDLGELNHAISAFADTFGASKDVVQYQPSTVPMLPSQAKVSFNPDATYLLVGCLGGLGRSLTSWMMESGARRFTFLSRSGADSQQAAQLVQDLEEAGSFVQVVRGDASSRADVVRAVEGVAPEHPIKGVVHAAMVLRDGLFHSMTYESWVQSTRPKVLGAQNLQSVLGGTALDFFVMTSSVSGVLGTPGQGNYAAANAYLDALARSMKRAGQGAATSLVLPMVLGVGVVAEKAELEEGLRRKGMYGIDEEELLQGFAAGMLSSAEDDHVVVGLDPARLRDVVRESDEADCFWLEDARFSLATRDIKASSAEEGGANGAENILATIKAAASPAEAVVAVSEHFAGKLARMLMLDMADIDPHAGSIASYGIDSMIGAELRNWIFKEYRIDVPFQRLLGPALTIAKFAGQVCSAHGVEAAA
ncbi:KR domain-containing protein [Xylariomycetidae sp. FL0641]|nr:KR domain-containing protein [Xylariomycetidae sp. FL0641]